MNGINAAVYFPKGGFFVAGGAVGVVRRWDLNGAAPTVRYNYQIGSPIFSLAVSSTGEEIAATSSDKTIRLLDANTGLLVRSFRIASNGVDQHLLFFENGNALISVEPVGNNRQPSLIRFWDVKKGVETFPPVMCHKYRIISCCMSPNQALFVTASLDGTIIVWRISKRTPVIAERERVQCRMPLS